MPSRTTANFARGRDAERDELVPHLGADGDERVGDAGERRLDRAEHARPERAEVPAQDVAVERVDDDRGGARPATSAATRPTAPAFAVCVCTIVRADARG